MKEIRVKEQIVTHQFAPYAWETKRYGDMRVPGWIYVDEHSIHAGDRGLGHQIGLDYTRHVDGREKKVIVHRKGATRAFGQSTPTCRRRTVTSASRSGSGAR
jgi:hypothetical protein